MGGTPHWRRGHLATRGHSKCRQSWTDHLSSDHVSPLWPIARREPIEARKAALARLLRKAKPGLQFNEHIAVPGNIVLRHACALGLEDIVSKRLGSLYVSGRSRDWFKFKNPNAPTVNREFEEDWEKRSGGEWARRPHGAKRQIVVRIGQIFVSARQ
jgi:hypothetical protein